MMSREKKKGGKPQLITLPDCNLDGGLGRKQEKRKETNRADGRGEKERKGRGKGGKKEEVVFVIFAAFLGFACAAPTSIPLPLGP